MRFNSRLDTNFETELPVIQKIKPI